MPSLFSSRTEKLIIFSSFLVRMAMLFGAAPDGLQGGTVRKEPMSEPAASPEIRTLPDLRWHCRSCGSCCHGVALGPVRPSVIRALERADIAAAWAPAARRSWYQVRQEPGAGESFWLAQRDGACVFLGPDQRCAIHRLLGEQAKPVFCREFPVLFTEEPGGYAAVVRASCAGLHASRLDGHELGPILPDLLCLPRSHPLLRFDPEIVQILPQAGVSLANWIAAEAPFLDLLKTDEEQPEQTIARFRETLHHVVGKPAPPADSGQYRAAVRILLGRLRRLLQILVGARSHQGLVPDERLTRIACLLDEARARLEDEIPRLGVGARGYANLLLRSLVLGKQFRSAGGLPRALGLFLLDLQVARSATSAIPDSALSASALSQALIPWLNFTSNRTVVHELQRCKDELTQLFMHAAPSTRR